MLDSVSFNNFRGLDNVTVPLTQFTMLTGSNGIGKTSVLEGLYCLFSQTKLDVSPLTRYSKTTKLTANLNGNISASQVYDYKLFWDECPNFGSNECSVAVKSDSAEWKWTYTKAYIEEIKDLINYQPLSINTNTEFAKWKWSITKNSDECEFNRAQILNDDGNFQLIPMNTIINSSFYGDCLYIDFPLFRVASEDLPLNISKELTKAILLLNSHVTDVRFAGINKGFSIVLDGEKEVSLGTLGNGVVVWASTLHTILIRREEFLPGIKQNSAPLFILIDEFGAGIHYSVMLNIWRYLKTFAEENPYLNFVFTSHSDDCIKAYCEAFKESDQASIVRMYKTFNGNKIITTEYRKEDFPNIADDEWEVRG
jgi:AAA15 family ATPase/GTPase